MLFSFWERYCYEFHINQYFLPVLRPGDEYSDVVLEDVSLDFAADDMSVAAAVLLFLPGSGGLY